MPQLRRHNRYTPPTRCECREIEPDHYGLSLAVGDGSLPEQALAAIRARRPVGNTGVEEFIGRFVTEHLSRQN